MRWASPVIHFRRTATRDSELGGQKLREGEKIVLWYNSANRDELAFVEPYRFDVTRTPNEHVGFGGPGAHHCLGANLARREITVVFRELFRRLPDLEISGEPEMLHVELHPRHQAHAVPVHAGWEALSGKLRGGRLKALFAHGHRRPPGVIGSAIDLEQARVAYERDG